MIWRWVTLPASSWPRCARRLSTFWRKSLTVLSGPSAFRCSFAHIANRFDKDISERSVVAFVVSFPSPWFNRCAREFQEPVWPVVGKAPAFLSVREHHIGPVRGLQQPLPAVGVNRHPASVKYPVRILPVQPLSPSTA